MLEDSAEQSPRVMEQRLGATGEPHTGQAGRIQETALPVRAIHLQGGGDHKDGRRRWVGV